MKEKDFDAICQSSIQAYLDASGIEYEKQGDYLRLKDHDSLVVDTRLTPNHPYELFFWNSENVGGNLYNFVKYYMGIEKGQDIIDNIKDTLGGKVGKQMPHSIHKQPKKSFNGKFYPAAEHTDQVVTYLTQVRKIPVAYVSQLIKCGLIRQLKNGNCGFVWRNEKGKVVGLDQQGTKIDHQKYGKRGTLKKIARYSEPHFGWNFGLFKPNAQRKNVLMVFEDPIDAISHAVMANHDPKCSYRYLSLNGAGSKLVNTVSNMLSKADYQYDEVRLCLDNDAAGIGAEYDFLYMAPKFGKDQRGLKPSKYPDKTIPIVVEQPNPKFKDWNDALKAQSTEINRLNIKTIKPFSEKRNGDFQKILDNNCPYYREIQQRLQQGTLSKKKRKSRQR